MPTIIFKVFTMDSGLLDFAYKYPFSAEAKKVVEELGGSAIDNAYLKLAEVHIREAEKRGLFSYSTTRMESLKRDYVIVYLYSRLLLSALKSRALIETYALAEARRAVQVVREEGFADFLRLSHQLGVNLVRLGRGELFSMDVFDFLGLVGGEKGRELVNQQLRSGVVELDPERAMALMTLAVRKRVALGLPIDQKELPDGVVEYARALRFDSLVKKEGEEVRGAGWIDGLLGRAVIDGRHRIVNLILAPYLMNVKKMEIDKAVSVINEYIERCKAANAATNINERYIRYQCAYAKRRGLRPLSLKRARETFGDIV